MFGKAQQLIKLPQQPGWNFIPDFLYQNEQQKKYQSQVQRINKQNQQIKKRNQLFQKAQRQLEQQKQKLRLQAIQKQIQQKKRIQIQKQKQKYQKAQRQRQRLQQQENKLKQQKQRQQRRIQQQKQLKQYQNDTFGYYQKKLGHKINDLNDYYNQSTLKKIVDNTGETVGNYADSLMGNIHSYTAGMKRQAQGFKQSVQADQDFAKGDFIGYLKNSVSGAWNKSWGENQMGAGTKGLQNFETMLAPLLLGGSALMYSLQGSKADKLVDLYNTGGKGNFTSLASKMIKDGLVDQGNKFQQRYKKFKKNSQGQLINRAKRKIAEKSQKIFDKGTQYLQKKGQKFVDSLANDIDNKFKQSKMGKYIEQKTNVPQQDQQDEQQQQILPKKIKK